MHIDVWRQRIDSGQDSLNLVKSLSVHTGIRYRTLFYSATNFTNSHEDGDKD